MYLDEPFWGFGAEGFILIVFFGFTHCLIACFRTYYLNAGLGDRKRGSWGSWVHRGGLLSGFAGRKMGWKAGFCSVFSVLMNLFN